MRLQPLPKVQKIISANRKRSVFLPANKPMMEVKIENCGEIKKQAGKKTGSQDAEFLSKSKKRTRDGKEGDEEDKKAKKSKKVLQTT